MKTVCSPSGEVEDENGTVVVVTYKGSSIGNWGFYHGNGLTTGYVW